MAESAPSFFLCPISLEVMKSPVSLTTGVTYDRTSIQTWLDAGHATCPVTMQPLLSTHLTPNLVIRRLIRLWSNPADVIPSPLSPPQLLSKLDSSSNPLPLLELLKEDISSVDPSLCITILSRLIDSEKDNSEIIDSVLSCFISLAEEREARPEMARRGVVSLLSGILSRPATRDRTAEKALELMERLISCAEGRAAIVEDAAAITAILRRMVAAPERGIGIVWTMCCLFGSDGALKKVAAGNGVTKVLLAMQCDCSAAARGMARDLFRLFFVERAGCFHGEGFDLKATHIMPF